MGVIWDIVKDIPTAAVLKEKILDLDAKLASTETQVRLLEIDLREAKLQIKELQTENKELQDRIEAFNKPSEELHEMAVRILQAFTNHIDSIPDYYIQQTAQLGPTEFSYYLDDLAEQGYIRLSYSDDDGAYYGLEQKGRKYLLDNPS